MANNFGPENGPEIVRMVDISKSFPGVKALDGVHLSVHAGEVHALVGENGAGKSTLIKILMGAYTPDAGEIYIDGNLVDIKSPQHAKQLGLGAVYQDVTLARHLSVGENFFLGKLPRKAGLVDWNSVHAQTQRICEGLGIRVNPRMLIKDLTVAQQEMITIAKVVHGNARVIVFDEPTALLANEETQELFDLIARLKAAGVGIIYISHRLEEIFQICDTVTVLKDGKFVKSMPVAESNQNELITLMVGRKMEDMYDISRVEPGETVLSVRGLTRQGVFADINFDLRRGEILGFFGLVGSGRTEVMRCLFGADKYDSGEITLNNSHFTPRSPATAIKHGIGLLPEDRKQQGLALQLSVASNINMGGYAPISSAGFIRLGQERAVADQFVGKLTIRTPSIAQKVGNLSGGNQQKVVVGRWLNRGSKVFIFDEPTVGVDVGAKAEIYRLLEELIKQGDSIIIVSSYLPEVMGLSDRIVVLREGRQMGTVERKDFNDELLLQYATALKTDTAPVTSQV
jgi:ribose transport system ATP-binding protein